MPLGPWVRRTFSRIRAIGRRQALDADIEAELADHVEAATAYHVERGLSPTAARRAALASLGGLETSRQALRDVRLDHALTDLWQDVRYGLRALRRAPTFTVVTLMTLAIGIGANTAVFTVVNGTLLRPMPFRDPGRLYCVSFAPVAGSFRPGPVIFDIDLVPFERTQTIFGGLAVSTGPSGATLTGAGDPVRLVRINVTPNYFTVLGVPPLIGRTFVDGEADGGRDHVVLISASLWRGRFGSDPNIAARSIRLDGNDYRVVGVAPEGFTFPHRADLWTPFEPRLMKGRIQFVEAIGRLKDGTTAAEAQFVFSSFIRQLPIDPHGPRREPDWAARVVPVQDLVVANARLPIQVFAGAVSVVLLIACVNVANLMLVRATGRARETAVRAALGASRSRLVRQFLTESALLAGTGGLVGLGLAAGGVRGLRALAPLAVLPRPDMVRIDGWVLAFTAVVTLVTGLAFGLLPAIQATGAGSGDALREARRGASVGGERIRAGLATAEIALALVLLAGGILLLRSFTRLAAVDPGFQPDHRVAASLSFPRTTYQSAQQVQAFHTTVLARLLSFPTIEAAAAVNDRPLGHEWTMGDFTLRSGRKLPAGWIVNKIAVSPRYFQTLEIPLLAGRDFTTADDEYGTGVVIVSESVVRTLWPHGQAIGQELSNADQPTGADWLTIVGVVADVHQTGLDQPIRGALYESLYQARELGTVNHASYIVRTAGDPATVAPLVRTAIHSTDANLPIETLAALPDLISATTATPRFQTWLIGVFALVALALAAIGISGVLAYSVSLRTRELGIRVALGASRGEVVGLLLGQALRVAGVGLAIGLSAAWFVSRILTSVLFEIRPHDLWAFGAAVGVLLVVVFAAALGPALRARAVNPVEALRVP